MGTAFMVRSSLFPRHLQLLSSPRSVPCCRFLALSGVERCTHIRVSCNSIYQLFPEGRSKFNVPCNGQKPITLNRYRNNLSRVFFTRSPDNRFFEKGYRDIDYGNGKKQLFTAKSFLKAAKSVTTSFIHFLNIMLVALLTVLLAISGAPSILSSKSGLHAAVSLTNKMIPGHMKVQSMSVGWNKHITLQGVSLEGVDGDVVLSIPKLETNSSLLSIVRGKAGLGDCTVTSPTFDLQEDKVIGLSKLALAIAPPHKLLKSKHRVKVFTTHGKKKRKLQPAVNVMLSATIKASGGDLQVVDGKLILPNDIATVLGKKVLLDVLLGAWATQESEELKEDCKTKRGVIPIKIGMWSDCTEAEALGFLNPKKMEVELIKPVKVEMDLNPEVGQLYLAQVNPLLGEIVGPAVQDDDMPDVIMYISPESLTLPAELYKIRFEPMKAILARGPLVGGVLNLLSSGKKDLAQGRKEVTLQTSRIEADIGLDGHLKCSRIDFLIAGKVHIAIWGLANWIDETVTMTLAIPGTTLTNVLGQFNLPKTDYNLKIPIGGTFECPEVNWKSAGIGLAQLALYQRGPSFMKEFLTVFDSNEEPVPELSENLPWNSESS